LADGMPSIYGCNYSWSRGVISTLTAVSGADMNCDLVKTNPIYYTLNDVYYGNCSIVPYTCYDYGKL